LQDLPPMFFYLYIAAMAYARRSVAMFLANAIHLGRGNIQCPVVDIAPYALKDCILTKYCLNLGLKNDCC